MAKQKKPKEAPAPLPYRFTCGNCGKRFGTKRRSQRFCSGKCRYEAWYRKEQDRRRDVEGFEDRLRRVEQAVGIRQS